MLQQLKNLWLRIAGAHRSADDTEAGRVKEFLLPRPTRGFFLRMGVVAVFAVLVFSFVLIPCFIDGESMLPTYPSHGFTFCWRGKYLFSEPKRGDVVIVKYRPRVFFLKRIVGLPGDTVEFRHGDLYVNGEKADEPYLRYLSDWDLPPRTVEPGHYYVVGDNRSQPIGEHMFGQVLAGKILGSPLLLL